MSLYDFSLQAPHQPNALQVEPALYQTAPTDEKKKRPSAQKFPSRATNRNKPDCIKVSGPRQQADTRSEI